MKNVSTKPFYFTIICLFCLVSFSCSLHIEKRRYRPGYHVDVVKNNPKREKNNRETNISVNRSTENAIQITTINTQSLVLTKGTSDLNPERKLKQPNTRIQTPSRYKGKPAESVSSTSTTPSQFVPKKQNHINHSKSTQANGKGLGIWGLVLAILAFIAFGIGIGFSTIGWFGFIAGAITGGFGVITAAIGWLLAGLSRKREKTKINLTAMILAIIAFSACVLLIIFALVL